jgi:hypothetical protein
METVVKELRNLANDVRELVKQGMPQTQRFLFQRKNMSRCFKRYCKEARMKRRYSYPIG